MEEAGEMNPQPERPYEFTAASGNESTAASSLMNPLPAARVVVALYVTKSQHGRSNRKKGYKIVKPM